MMIYLLSAFSYTWNTSFNTGSFTAFAVNASLDYIASVASLLAGSWMTLLHSPPVRSRWI